MSNAEIKNEDNGTLEEILDNLDGLIEEMQKGDLTLEETFAGYKKGIELTLKAEKKIEKIESDIKLLTPDE
ncbi:MAG: exodeoxyribonuclease VII small subunit [Lachnospiraceae bacterium]|jgi:exodeoxyribonuclease VII small subunit